jgi:hypothetical protein
MKFFRLSVLLTVRVDHALRLLGVTALAAFLSACSHSVALEPTSPIPSATAPVPLAAKVSIPPKTANHVHTVRSGLAGFANTWDINVGEAISDYSKAFFANTITPGSEAVIQIDLVSFNVRDFEARCELNFTIQRDGRDVFQKSYQGKGLGYAARVVWGGPFAMKSSMRKTTDEALRSIFTQFLQDVTARKREGLLW